MRASSLCAPLAVCALLSLALWPRTVAAQKKCMGQYDVFFVLDRTGSMFGDPFGNEMQFTKYFLDNFSGSSDKSRYFFVTFSEDATLDCGESTMTEALACSDAILQNVLPDGATYIGSGIIKATEQLKYRKGTGNVPLMLVITDGGENAVVPGGQTAVEAGNDARTAGANLFVIGISSADLKEEFLKQIAGPGNSNKFMMVNKAQDLTETLSHTIAAALCTEVTEILSGSFCLADLNSDGARVTLKGNMIVDENGKPKVTCTFISNDGKQYPAFSVQASDPGTPDTSDVYCIPPSSILNRPPEEQTGTYTVRVTLNGGATQVSGASQSTMILVDDDACIGKPKPPPIEPNIGARVASMYGRDEVCAMNGTVTVSLLVRRMSPNVPTECELQLEEPNPQNPKVWAGTTSFREVVADNYADGTVDFAIDCTVQNMQLVANKTYYVYLYDTSLTPRSSLTGRGALKVVDCVETTAVWPYVAAASILLLLLLLWFFWPYLAGTVVYKPKPVMKGQAPAAVVAAPPPPPPAKAPPRKWGVVDASKYIWARDGGTARPINVKWGEMGPTPMSGNLEAMGDEAALAEAEKASTGTTEEPAKKVPKGASVGSPNTWYACMACCCGGMASCWAATYKQAAATRPQRMIYRVRK